MVYLFFERSQNVYCTFRRIGDSGNHKLFKKAWLEINNNTMKKIFIFIAASFVFTSCQVPFPVKVETPNTIFGKNADGSVFFNIKRTAPVVIDNK